MVCAKFSRQRLFVVTSVDCNCFKTHLASVLNSEMPESADAVHGHHVAGARARMPQRIKYGYACAHERTGFLGGQFVGNRGECRGRYNHVLGITAVEVDAGDLSIDAHGEVTAATLFADKTMSTVPTH